MNKTNPLMILLILASFASVCAVLYTPALPDIATFLKISDNQAQKSLSLFLVGYAFGNLPWGPIANRFGRKSATIFGLYLAIIGILITLLIKIYPYTWILNLGRLITALGASVGIKMAFTYISDLYSKEERTLKIAYLMLSFALVPGLAIVCGGLLTKLFGWYSCFYAMLIYTAISLVLTRKLPETLKKEHIIPLKVHTIIEGYSLAFKNKILIKASFMMGCATTFIYLFASLAPFIGINELGLKPEAYGFYNFIPSIGMVLGFYLTQFLQNKFSCFNQIKLGIIISTSFVTILAIFFVLKIIHPLTLFIPMPGVYVGLSLIFANTSSLAISEVPNKSNASAMTNFLNMGFCVTSLFVAEALPYKASFLLPILYIILCITMIGLFVGLKKNSPL